MWQTNPVLSLFACIFLFLMLKLWEHLSHDIITVPDRHRLHDLVHSHLKMCRHSPNEFGRDIFLSPAVYQNGSDFTWDFLWCRNISRKQHHSTCKKDISPQCNKNVNWTAMLFGYGSINLERKKSVFARSLGLLKCDILLWLVSPVTNQFRVEFFSVFHSKSQHNSPIYNKYQTH